MMNAQPGAVGREVMSDRRPSMRGLTNGVDQAVVPPGKILVDADGLMSIDELSRYTGIPKKTLYYWRLDRRGPWGMKLGKHVRYRRADVEAWLDGLLDHRHSARGLAQATRRSGP
jgi:excisionase family DNA binding protein